MKIDKNKLKQITPASEDELDQVMSILSPGSNEASQKDMSPTDKAHNDLLDQIMDYMG